MQNTCTDLSLALQLHVRSGEINFNSEQVRSGFSGVLGKQRKEARCRGTLITKNYTKKKELMLPATLRNNCQ